MNTSVIDHQTLAPENTQSDTNTIDVPSGNVPVSLHIGIDYDKGGAGRVLSELATFLPAANIDTLCLVENQRKGSVEPLANLTCFADQNLAFLPRLYRARTSILQKLLEYKPDIIASHFAMYTATALDALRTQRNVSHFHGPWCAESAEEGQSRVLTAAKARVEGAVYRRADRVIVLSQAFGDLAIRRFRVASDRIRVIPGSVDLRRFSMSNSRQDSRAILDLPLDRPVLVAVRRLVRRMGLGTLITAMVRVVAAVPDVLLCIAGEGPLRPVLEAQVQQLGLGRHVRFLGFIKEEELPHLYYAADLNVVPTFALEGFGLVAAEAMATGTPSMVTPVGGLPEVVAGLSRNLIFPSNLPDPIADSLIDVLKGSTTLPSRSQCQQYIRDTFSSTLMAQRTALVYRELL